MKRRLAIFLLTVIIVLGVEYTVTWAQQGTVSVDRVNCTLGADTVAVPSNVRFLLRLTNNTGRKVDISNGFKISSPDGVQWDSVTISSARMGFSSYFDIVFGLVNFATTGLQADTFGIMAAGTPLDTGRQLPSGYNDTSLAVTVWGLKAADTGKHICFDTCFFRPGGTWQWVRVDQDTDYKYHPSFQGPAGQSYSDGLPGTRIGSGYCYMLYSPSCPEVSQSSRARGTVGILSCPCTVCCVGTRGNVNEAGIVDLSDLSALVSFLTGGGYVLPCEDAANVNGAGIVDLSDLSALVSYLTGGGYVLPACP